MCALARGEVRERKRLRTTINPSAPRRTFAHSARLNEGQSFTLNS